MTVNRRERNPFIVGSPVSTPKLFIGRQYEIQQVMDRLLNSAHESSSVVGERRVGKTSLLYYLQSEDVRKLYDFDEEKYVMIYFDPQVLENGNTPFDFWINILRKITERVQIHEATKIMDGIVNYQSVNNFILMDFFDCLKKENKQIVLLLDEFERVTRNSNFDTDFFQNLRFLAIHKNLTLITSSQKNLLELTHSPELSSSPFFNIFSVIHLGLMNESDTKDLLDTYLESSQYKFSLFDINALEANTGWHPFFFQMGCNYLFDAYLRGYSGEKRFVFIEEKIQEQAELHYKYFWVNSTDKEKIVLTILAFTNPEASKTDLGQKQLDTTFKDENKTIFDGLYRRCLLKRIGNDYYLVNRTFAKWIIKEIPSSQSDDIPYEIWYQNNQDGVKKMNRKIKKELSELLPLIKNNYRDLFFRWISDPKTALQLVETIKNILTK
jgi:hypothetical protein